MQIEIADHLTKASIFEVEAVRGERYRRRHVEVNNAQIAVNDDDAFAHRVEDRLQDLI